MRPLAGLLSKRIFYFCTWTTKTSTPDSETSVHHSPMHHFPGSVIYFFSFLQISHIKNVQLHWMHHAFKYQFLYQSFRILDPEPQHSGTSYLWRKNSESNVRILECRVAINLLSVIILMKCWHNLALDGMVGEWRGGSTRNVTNFKTMCTV